MKYKVKPGFITLLNFKESKMFPSGNNIKNTYSILLPSGNSILFIL